ncbi:hypothetical protein Patl1_27787 [Pistacia atlantica]|uniref:Uncharacterized protein n=1 Tax=Pistacia atlantica TaxID=434234 RepID=A0ACC1BHD1_9ROSI|nr:hypothetical protein Patl1_27787 [Pistacia atlantica]
MGTRTIKSDNGSSTLVLSPLKPQTLVKVASKKAMILILLVTIGFISGSCVFLLVSGFFIFKYRVVEYKWLLETGNWKLEILVQLMSLLCVHSLTMSLRGQPMDSNVVWAGALLVKSIKGSYTMEKNLLLSRDWRR